ncbi:unnamed protein product [Microthlaspi erraticum]|uniref:Uncharacterized protein n=1 Tax=Microthlaspi erraticum TaxID=1685480 RepID=A0A6D2J8U1_9BRAS|nr:unnamed protein product [Microthlaspi erraticum]
MGIFSEFGRLMINQNVQQPQKAESSTSENVKSKPASEKDTNTAPAKVKVNNEEDEDLKQDIFWSNAEKKRPWFDAPPRVKVTTKNGLCHMHIEMTMGMTPEGVYETFINPHNLPIFIMGKRQLLV